MNILAFPISYLFWHYSKALKNIFGIFSNFFWSIYNFFSISLLLKTFFTPWHRLDVERTKKNSFEDFIGTIIVNTLMRLVGMMIRFFIIIFYIIATLFLFVFEIIFFIAWLLLPGIVIGLIYNGLSKII